MSNNESRAPMSPDIAESYLRRIESAIDDIREQGFGHSTGWYALDRFALIQELAGAAAKHPRNEVSDRLP